MEAPVVLRAGVQSNAGATAVAYRSSAASLLLLLLVLLLLGVLCVAASLVVSKRGGLR